MIIIETRIQLQTLAKLARYYLSHHRIVRSRSHLIRTALEEYVELLDPSSLTPTEALSILGELGLTNNKRTRLSIMQDLQKESLELDNIPINDLMSTLEDNPDDPLG